jgi:hypothetical protein
MLSARFEPAASSTELQQANALDRSAPAIGIYIYIYHFGNLEVYEVWYIPLKLLYKPHSTYKMNFLKEGFNTEINFKITHLIISTHSIVYEESIISAMFLLLMCWRSVT